MAFQDLASALRHTKCSSFGWTFEVALIARCSTMLCYTSDSVTHSRRRASIELTLHANVKLVLKLEALAILCRNACCCLAFGVARVSCPCKGSFFCSALHIFAPSCYALRRIRSQERSLMPINHTGELHAIAELVFRDSREVSSGGEVAARLQRRTPFFRPVLPRSGGVGEPQKCADESSIGRYSSMIKGNCSVPSSSQAIPR